MELRMTKVVFLTKGQTALVDDEDYEMVNKINWCVSGGYAYNGARGPMHRFLLSAPTGVMVDHIDGNRLNNRRSNLRLCSNSQNQANRQVFRGASPFKGVVWQKRTNGTGSWKAQLVDQGVVIYLGVFKTDREAAAAYNEEAIRRFGKFASLNDLSLQASSLQSHERRQVNRSNPSGFKGVSFDAGRGRWMAQLACKGKTHLKKRFKTAEEAARAYDEVARAIYGLEAQTNF